MKGTYPAPRIQVAPDATENGLAGMIADLLRQNLDDHPHKREDFARMLGRVCLIAEDADVSLTLVFDPNRLTVYDGIVGIPHIVVRATSDDIIQLSLIELTTWGWPDPRGEVAKQVVQGMRSGRISVWGAFKHLPMALRLTRIMAVN